VPAATPSFTLALSPCGSVDTVGENTLIVQVRRIGDASTAATVDWSVTPGTAVLGTHYNCTPTSGVLTWAAGDGSDKFITVQILEGDPAVIKTFNVTLSNPAGTGYTPVGACNHTLVSILSC
jgi:hypothetical protein